MLMRDKRGLVVLPWAKFFADAGPRPVHRTPWLANSFSTNGLEPMRGLQLRCSPSFDMSALETAPDRWEGHSRVSYCPIMGSSVYRRFKACKGSGRYQSTSWQVIVVRQKGCDAQQRPSQ